MGFFSEFKEFAMKGNVIDLAVGVVIGGAFGKIVNSFVEDLINPLVGILTGGTDLTQHFVVLQAGKTAGVVYESVAKAKADGANVLAYGNLLNNVFQFLIIAFAIFIVIKQMNRLIPLKGDNLPK